MEGYNMEGTKKQVVAWVLWLREVDRTPRSRASLGGCLLAHHWLLVMPAGGTCHPQGFNNKQTLQPYSASWL